MLAVVRLCETDAWVVDRDDDDLSGMAQPAASAGLNSDPHVPDQCPGAVARLSPLGYRMVSRERDVDSYAQMSAGGERPAPSDGLRAPDLTVVTLSVEAPSGLDAPGRRTLAREALSRLGATEAPRGLLGDRVFVVLSSPVTMCAVVSGASEQLEEVTAAVVLAALQRDHLTRIDAALLALRSEAEVDVEHAPSPSLTTLRNRRRLEATSRRVKRLVLLHENARGAFANSWRYVDGPIGAPLHAAVAGICHFESWFEEQEDALETLNDLYDAITEKLSEAKNVVVEVILEVSIIVVLLLELALLAIDLL